MEKIFQIAKYWIFLTTQMDGVLAGLNPITPVLIKRMQNFTVL